MKEKLVCVFSWSSYVLVDFNILLDLSTMRTGLLTGKPIIKIPDPNRLFTGHYYELQKLDTELRKSSSDQRTRIFPAAVQIYGPVGIGKTQLAKEYVNQDHVKRKFSSFLWVEARSIQTIERSFSELADRISINNWDHYARLGATLGDEENMESTNIPQQPSPVSTTAEGQGLRLPAIKLVKDWLAASDNTNWLMVFDGAEDCKSLHLEDLIPDVRHGNVILTSRDYDFAKFSRGILLGPMNEKDSIELLSKAISTTSRTSKSEGEGCSSFQALFMILTDY